MQQFAREVLADLNDMLEADGEDVTLQRMAAPSGGAASVASSVTARARLMEIGAANRNQDLVGNVAQGDIVIVMSPTEIIAAGWTAGRVSGDDDRVPTKGNRVVRAGRIYTVQKGFGKYVYGALVRIEVVARG